MRRTWLPIALSALVLSGCAAAVTAPLRTATGAIGAKGRVGHEVRAAQAEAGVEQARLEATLKVLTGKEAAADGARIAERGTETGRAQTRAFLASSLASLGYTVERHKYRASGENLYVTLPAETPNAETILVGAHMDSVKNAGANDNGTGTAAVLEVARVLKTLPGRKLNVIFAFFDEEELGLIGSRALAKELKARKLNVSSVHTIDMMGWDADHDKAIEIERPDGGLWDYYRMVNETHHLNLTLTRTNSGDTDHVAFRAEGFASVGLCEEWANHDTTPYYHQKTDTYETVDFGYLTSTTRFMAAVIGDLARQVPAPAPTKRLPHDAFPGRDHGCNGEHE